MSLQKIQKQMLESDIQEKIDKVPAIEQSLAETMQHTSNLVNVKELGAVGNGVADDTILLQQIINEHNHIFIPNGVYKFSRLVIENSNKKIVFGENVVLKSDLNVNDDRKGYIDIIGTKDTVNYPIQQDVKMLSNVLYVTTTSATNFNVGDMIEIEQTRPLAGSSLVTTEEEHRKQNSYAVLTIKSVDTTTGKVEVYESIPHDFKLVDSPYITKINAVKDIEILGTNTQYDKMGVIGLGNFFNVQYGYNVKIQGFHCYNGGGKGIVMFKTNRFFISDFTFSKPSVIDSAKGDGIVINRSGYGIIERCYIYRAGRGIDFTVSWNCVVKDCMTMQCGFSTHGILSKYITFTDCVVYGRPGDSLFYGLLVGNADYMFDEYIVFENCHVYGGYYGLHTVANSKHVTISNCHFYNNIMAIISRDGENIIIKGCTFNDCEVDIRFQGVINSKIKDCNIYAKNNYVQGGGSIHISDATQNIDIDGVNILKNRSVVVNIEASTLIPANIKIMNTVIRNLMTATEAIRIYSKGVELINCETNDVLWMQGVEQITVRNSKFPNLRYYSANTPTKNFINKDNIYTGVNGVAPALVTDASKNIHVVGNIYLLNI